MSFVVRARRASVGAWVPVLRGPFGLPCGAPVDRGLARTRLRLKQSPALIRSPVRSSTTQNRRPSPGTGPAGVVVYGTLGGYGGMGKKIMGVKHLSTVGELPDDLLSLSELLALIKPGLEAVFMMNLSESTHKIRRITTAAWIDVAV